MDTEKLEQALSYSDSMAIRNLINRTLIIEWGTVEEVIDDNTVDVLISVAERPENVTLVTCTLISPCSKAMAFRIKPAKGDKVLVLSPRHFDMDMFTVSDKAETIIDEDMRGYNKMSCLGILYNRFDDITYTSFAEFTDSGFTIKDSNGCEIKSDSEGIVINSKLKVKV